MEVWRNVVGYEGVYQVSNFGRVRRVKVASGAVKGRVLKPGVGRTGIKNVNLCVESRARSYTVHRLAALAFLGAPPTPRHQVAHNDGNPANNRLANLRWATPAENSFDQVVHGTQKGKHYGRPAALTDDQVRAIRADHRPERCVAPDYGISMGTVGQIRRRETYQHLPPLPGDYQPARNRLRLSDAEVRAIRCDPRETKVIADELKCSSVTVWAIRARQSYGHVSDDPAEHPAVLEPVAIPAERNVLCISGSTGTIQLPQGVTALFDAADAPHVRARRWRAARSKYTHYVTAQSRDAHGRLSTVFLHRALMNPPEGMVVDHINGDGLDNRRENLRIVTVAQNNLNSRVRRDNQSGLKGAFYNSSTGAYYSRIKTDSGYVGLGTFASAEEAAEAYAKASARYHGEFGRTYLDD